jgi:hypothetical protein
MNENPSPGTSFIKLKNIHNLPGQEILTLGMEGTMKVLYNPKGEAWRSGLDWYRLEVNPHGDDTDLAAYIATSVLDTGMRNPTKVDRMPPVTVMDGTAPVPEPFPWCVVVLPTVRLTADR